MISSIARYEDLTPDDLREVNATCDCFERAIRDGEALRAEEWAAKLSGPLYEVVLAELLLLECEYQLRNAPGVGFDELTRRYPHRPEFLRNTLEQAKYYAGLPVLNAHGGQSRLRLPASIGRFRIIEQLGYGGFGVVYLASDPTLKRQVAVKVPHPHLADVQFAKQFQTEAVRMAGLEHPNLVTIYETGYADHQPYIVTAYVDGPNLAVWLAERLVAHVPVTAREASQIVRSLADVVDYVHGKGSLHCDIKPANILLGGANRDVPRLTDFGLSRMIDGTSELAMSGLLAGTPLYMAPEQVKDRGAKPSVATDVYSLGVVLYELLTGRPPVAPGSLTEVIQRIVECDPLRPRQIQPDIPSDLEAVCLKCLEKSPERRYRTARELAEDLSRFLTGSPVEAALPGKFRRLGGTIRRNRLRSALVLFGMLLLTATILGLTLHTTRLNRVNRDLETAQANLVQEQQTRQAQELVLRTEAYPDLIRAAGTALARWDRATARRILDSIPTQGTHGKLRGFEWRYLQARAADPVSTVIASVGKPLYSVDVSPDRQTLVFTGADGIVRLIRADTGKQVVEPWLHTHEVSRAVFSPDGRSVAFIGLDRTARIWNISTGDCRTVGTFPGTPHALAFHPIGDWLAIGGDNPAVTLIDLTDAGRLAKPYPEQGLAVRSLAFSPDGEKLAIGSLDRGVKLWKPFTSEPPETLSNDLLHINATRFSPDGEDILIGARNSLGAAIHSLRNKNALSPARELRDGTSSSERINDFAWSPTGRRLAVARETGVDIWEWPSRIKHTTIPIFGSRVYGIRFLATDDELVLVCENGTVRRCRVQEDAAISQQFVLGTADSLAFAPDGQQLLITCGASGQNLVSGLVARSSRPGAIERMDLPSPSHSVHRSPNGFMAFCHDGQLREVKPGHPPVVRPELERVKEIWHEPHRFSPILAMSASGRYLALAYDNNVAIWETKTGKWLRLWSEKNNIQAIAFLGDTSIASGGRDTFIRIRRIDDISESRVLSGHTRIIRGLCFTHDGTKLVSASWDRSVRVWSVADGTCLSEFRDHGGPVSCISISPDDKTIASGSDDGVVRLLHLTSGYELVTIPTGASIRCLAFDPKGQRLAVASALFHEGKATKLTMLLAQPANE